MTTLTTKCECGAEYCSAHELSEYAILKEKLAIAEKALEFYADDEAWDGIITRDTTLQKSKFQIDYVRLEENEIRDGMSYNYSHGRVAKQALAVIRGEVK